MITLCGFYTSIIGGGFIPYQRQLLDFWYLFFVSRISWADQSAWFLCRGYFDAYEFLFYFLLVFMLNNLIYYHPFYDMADSFLLRLVVVYLFICCLYTSLLGWPFVKFMSTVELIYYHAFKVCLGSFWGFYAHLLNPKRPGMYAFWIVFKYVRSLMVEYIYALTLQYQH